MRPDREAGPVMGRIRRKGFFATALLGAATLAGGLVIAVAPAIPAGANVSGVTVSVSSAAAGYTHNSTYTISFIATNGINSLGSLPIGLQAPPGTTFIGNGSVLITDHTNPADSIQGTCERQTNLTYTADIDDCGNGGLHIASGDSVTITVEATNPAAGNYTLSLTTDNDPNPVSSAPYSIINEVDPSWTVVVLTDRGLYAAWLFQAIVALGWHPMMRITPESVLARGLGPSPAGVAVRRRSRTGGKAAAWPSPRPPSRGWSARCWSPGGTGTKTAGTSSPTCRPRWPTRRGTGCGCGSSTVLVAVEGSITGVPWIPRDGA